MLVFAEGNCGCNKRTCLPLFLVLELGFFSVFMLRGPKRAVPKAPDARIRLLLGPVVEVDYT